MNKWKDNDTICPGFSARLYGPFFLTVRKSFTTGKYKYHVQIDDESDEIFPTKEKAQAAALRRAELLVEKFEKEKEDDNGSVDKSEG
ncbi:MAG: hypothetical protein GWM98_04860 [Nitrospinaceae bacterium]|nr:hypothetical protein [Deltaproteobacteria bacterium]NIY14251.1 hypothetical protein [Nitrospinaceae bacterium]